MPGITRSANSMWSTGAVRFTVSKSGVAMRESDIEAYLVKRVKALGGEIRKVKWIGRNGAPDRVVMLPTALLWVELKAPGEKCKPHQTREHKRMRVMGQCVEIVDSFESVDEVLK